MWTYWVEDDVRAATRPFKEYVVTWSRMQRPFMEEEDGADGFCLQSFNGAEAACALKQTCGSQ
jgi:hypothetical protein